MPSPLTEPVDRFIAELGPELDRIAAAAKMHARGRAHDVVLEAWNLAAAFVDADGLHTDEELSALVAAFGPRLDTVLAAGTPGGMRKARLVNGKRDWLQSPSLLLEILAGDDARNGTTNTWRYYSGALAIAHTVASLDTYPAPTELAAIEGFRSLVLRTLDRFGVPRPGTPVGRTQASAGAAASNVVQKADEPAAPPRPLDELLAELDSLVGLEPVKGEVKLVAALLQIQRLRKQRGLPAVDASRHLVFTGNPGTGKTTVARLLAEIYRTLEVVEKGQLVETDRSGLVAGYVGQTAVLVRQVVERALGGVLLIDEAYALARGDERDFGQEAIDTLVKLMEDHRDDLVVIAAGYPDEMHEFIESNPGLRSRFPKTIHFPDYTTDELVDIFESMTEKASYKAPRRTLDRVREIVEAEPRDKGFGNARLVRNLFEAAIAQQALRLSKVPEAQLSDSRLVTLLPKDVVRTGHGDAAMGAVPPGR